MLFLIGLSFGLLFGALWGWWLTKRVYLRVAEKYQQAAIGYRQAWQQAVQALQEELEASKATADHIESWAKRIGASGWEEA